VSEEKAMAEMRRDKVGGSGATLEAAGRAISPNYEQSRKFNTSCVGNRGNLDCVRKKVRRASGAAFSPSTYFTYG
jgi:hypothetical protein